MANLQIYLCRHGETLWTLSKQHTSTTDIALTENGKNQARLLGDRLKEIQFEKVFSSPLVRAKQTCTLAGLYPILSEDLMEWNYGKYEGLDHNEIIQTNPNWNLFTQGAPDGETPEQVGKRADHFFEKIKHLSGNIAIFSHGHFSRILAARWLNLNPEMGKLFYLSVASLSLLGFERKQKVVKLWNDSSHLNERKN